MKDLHLKLGITKIFSDFIAINIAWISAYYIRIKSDLIPFFQFEVASSYPEIQVLFKFFLFSSIWYIILASVQWQYRFRVNNSTKIAIFKAIYLSLLWWLLIIAFYALWKHELFFSRILLFQTLFISIILISSWRYLLRKCEQYFLKHWYWIVNVLLIWEGSVIDKINPPIQYRIVSTSLHLDQNKTQNIDEIWYIEGNNEEKVEILNYCQINQIWFWFIPNVEWVLLSKLNTSMIWSYPLLKVEPTPILDWWRIIKRFFDLLFSTILILILSPLLILISIIIKATSPWPILYISDRVWKNWETFKMFKFRSMVANAESIKKTLEHKNQRTWPLFKIKNDPRITKFWKFIRKTSIDELPQLFNVLIWNMSLVWPRAHLPNEIQKYSPLQKRVLMIKPWITWLAQINGRSNLDFDKEIHYDIEYIVDWSLLLDLQIIFITPFILLKWDWAD